jgi:crotonobetainyl-CoA:carnitine CoA-transferase CaiB-like acyl-CoA transferase
VSCSLTAFEGTEEAARPGYDIIVQALSGLMSVTGQPGGEPTKVGVALLDVITGLYAAIGILAALEERRATGRGRHVTVSLYGASVAAMVNQAANYLLGGVVPAAMGGAHPNIVPYQVFQASDRPFVLAAGNDKLFRLTCEVVGRPEFADDARFATNEARVHDRDRLIPLLADIFATRTAAAWLEALEVRGVPCSPIHRMDEVFASPEGASLVETIPDPVRGPLRVVANPIRIAGEASEHRPPPLVGEHTEEILRELEERESERRGHR